MQNNTNLYKNPAYTDICKILTECNLPFSDIKVNNACIFLACKEKSSIIGIIGLETHGNYGLLRSLAVKDKYRNKGYGKVLVDELEKLAQKKKVNNLYLITNTAEHFFKNLGYVKISRKLVCEEIKKTQEFSSICPNDATVMIKNL